VIATWQHDGLFHWISVHPLSRIHVFHGHTPEEFQTQNLLLNNSKIPSSRPFTPEEFQAQNLIPLFKEFQNSKLKILYAWRIFQAENPLPLKMNSKLKTLYPWWIPSAEPFTPEEFQAQNPLPGRIPNSKHFTPKEFQAQNTLPLKNSKLKTLYTWRIPGILDRGGGTDIKWNSPM
jgi:hypothetical protein